jgi:hypothetical protein
MKTTTALVALLTLFAAVPASAFSLDVSECAIKPAPQGGFYVKVDPACGVRVDGDREEEKEEDANLDEKN